MRQVEVSRTLVSTTPAAPAAFFEALVADNIGIGRPEEVAVVFARQIRTTRQDRSGPGSSAPAPTCSIDFRYKHSRVKQYLKEGRALRIETVINKPVRHRSPAPASSTCPSSSPRPAQVNVVCL